MLPSLQYLLDRELARGERVMWQSSPAPVSRALASASTFLFGIPFLAFALFWTWGATGGFGGGHGIDGAFSKFALLWGSMFIAAGTAMLLSPLWACWCAMRTLYAITDRRAILVDVPLWRATIRSFSGERLAEVVRRENPSGDGDLIFERELTGVKKGHATYREIGFFAIDQVRAVQRLFPLDGLPPQASDPGTLIRQ